MPTVSRGQLSNECIWGYGGGSYPGFGEGYGKGEGTGDGESCGFGEYRNNQVRMYGRGHGSGDRSYGKGCGFGDGEVFGHSGYSNWGYGHSAEWVDDAKETFEELDVQSK